MVILFGARRRVRSWRIRALAVLVICCALNPLPAQQASAPGAAASKNGAPKVLETPGAFLYLLFGQDPGLPVAFELIEKKWDASFVSMTIETLRFSQRPAVTQVLTRLLEANTGQSFGYDLAGWQRWLWNQPPNFHPGYAAFKATLYGVIDTRFKDYFDGPLNTDIRLDEVVWGGVRQDGIPPLRSPKMVPGAEAEYLGTDNVVFGISINGDARAYPKRILAWHEMFTDTVGGVPLAGVYCTLCGTVILYGTRVDGVDHELGTSGFLFRSNKLMYDKATQSLWNTMWGKPVLGPLLDKGIELPRYSVVTTTWGEWKRRHPQTTVLSSETGHMRDYAEGAAYREYFATDELMFEVPVRDERLKNKAEVLGLVFPAVPGAALALSARYLANNPVHHDAMGELIFVILTDASGANRVYRTDGRKIASYDGDRAVTDESGNRWTLEEDHLVGADGNKMPRLPAHRAFWFAWFAAFGHTRLVH